MANVLPLTVMQGLQKRENGIDRRNDARAPGCTEVRKKLQIRFKVSRVWVFRKESNQCGCEELGSWHGLSVRCHLAD